MDRKKRRAGKHSSIALKVKSTGVHANSLATQLRYSRFDCAFIFMGLFDISHVQL